MASRSKAFKAESGVRTQVTGGDYEGKVGEVIGEYEGQFRVSLDGTNETVLVDKGDLGAVQESEPEEEAPADAPTE